MLEKTLLIIEKDDRYTVLECKLVDVEEAKYVPIAAFDAKEIGEKAALLAAFECLLEAM